MTKSKTLDNDMSLENNILKLEIANEIIKTTMLKFSSQQYCKHVFTVRSMYRKQH